MSVHKFYEFMQLSEFRVCFWKNSNDSPVITLWFCRKEGYSCVADAVGTVHDKYWSISSGLQLELDFLHFRTPRQLRLIVLVLSVSAILQIKNLNVG